MTSNRDIEYLTRVLRMNPLAQTEEILAERAKYLADGADEVFVSAPEPATRGELSEKIEALRENFWSLDDDELKAELKVLDARRFPELDQIVQRLRKVAAVRESVNDLSDLEICGDEFLRTFREILLASPRQSAILKEEALGTPVEPCKARYYARLSREMCDAFPELFELEEEWLTRLIDRKRRGRSSGDDDDIGAFLFGCSFILGAILVICLIWKVLL